MKGELSRMEKTTGEAVRAERGRKKKKGKGNKKGKIHDIQINLL